jgi:hypothetical protein
MPAICFIRGYILFYSASASVENQLFSLAHYILGIRSKSRSQLSQYHQWVVYSNERRLIKYTHFDIDDNEFVRRRGCCIWLMTSRGREKMDYLLAMRGASKSKRSAFKFENNECSHTCRSRSEIDAKSASCLVNEIMICLESNWIWE